MVAEQSRVRSLLLFMLVVFTVIACTSDSGAGEESTTTTVTSPSLESSELDAAMARIAELEAELFAATSTTVARTTSMTLPMDLVVWSHETGEYIVEPFVDWVWGWVSDPQAEVDVNGVPLVVTEQVGSEWARSVDPWSAAWDFRPPDNEDWSVPLTEGRNMLMVTATFPDGLTIVDDIVVFHDPTLTTELGILTGYESDEPRTMTFGIGTEWQQPAGGGIEVESTATYRVAGDAVFKLEAADTSAWRVLEIDGFFELLEFVESGGCSLCPEDGCCPDRCIWAAWDGWDGLEFAIYLNADGDIQQLTQLHLSN